MGRALTLAEWLAIGQFLLTAVAASLVWLWGRGRDSGSANSNVHGQFALLREKVGELERRMDKAGQRTSDLADQVQVMPDKFRDEIREAKTDLRGEFSVRFGNVRGV